ncbi:hypothetical protein JCM15519_14710 [Fundidesulfovibrio butyratiphilus]
MGETLFIFTVFGVVALHWIAELLPTKRSMWLSELHLDQTHIWDDPARNAPPPATRS